MVAETTEKFLTSANKLLLKKVGVTAAIGFLAVFLPGVLTALDSIEGGDAHSFGTTFWFSLLAGAIAGALRAVLALSPVNLFATDALHSVGQEHPDEIVVSTEPQTTSTRRVA
jgi:hypothetical protein